VLLLSAAYMHGGRERIDEGGEDALSLFLSPSRRRQKNGEWWWRWSVVESADERGWPGCARVVVARASERRGRWKGIV